MSTSEAVKLRDFDSATLERLKAPAFRVADAARYTHVSTQTVRSWQKATVDKPSLIADRDNGVSLSFFHLMELHVVSALTRVGVSLSAIRLARVYAASEWKLEFPFAERKMETDGQNVIHRLPDVEARDEFTGKAIILNKGGQIHWSSLLGEAFTSIEFTENGKAARWHLAGGNSAVVIDPLVAFGTPSVYGIPTRLLNARLTAGDTEQEIADDYSIPLENVRQALDFESKPKVRLVA